ncbi:hypothetical protein [Winogradskyella eximia]|uniref:hypothetical protein n=1 Tax=Winogradskyella eximia TaxID=262006 RepID=UPI00248FFDA4|nr:hypothetical protein [Winogradskyella eximia]
MKKILLILILICSNSIFCQNTIELIAYDCINDRDSNRDISEIKFEILTKHKVISQTTKSKFDLFKFQTSENEVKIEYNNIYNQKTDTTYFITPKTQKLFLCVEKMKDYEIETFIEKSLEENKNWKLKLSGGGCFVFTDTEIKIIPNKNDAILKYKYVEERNGKKIKEKKEIKLDKRDLDNLIIFEKKLRLLNSAMRRCTPATYYYLSYGNETIEIRDQTCVGIFEEYLSKLIERNN